MPKEWKVGILIQKTVKVNNKNVIHSNNMAPFTFLC